MPSQRRAKEQRRNARLFEAAEAEDERRVEEAQRRLNAMSFMQKLRRADRHVADLESAIAAWTTDGYQITESTDERGIVTQYGQATRGLPESVPLLIGDATQCLLNALDHLAFAIGASHAGGMTVAEEERSQFPIGKSGRRDSQGRIPDDPRTAKWPACAQAMVGVMQPYLGSAGLNDHPLWLLRDLANRDKHRSITATAFSHVVHEFKMGNGYIDHLQFFGSEAFGDQPVPLIAYSRRNRGDIRITRSLAVRFAEGPLVAGREVVPTLRELRLYLEEVVIGHLGKFV